MKKSLLISLLLISFVIARADNLQIYAIINGDPRTTTDGIGYRNPCELMDFVAEFSVTSNYSFKNYTWTVAGVPVKTATSVADRGLSANLIGSSLVTEVKCTASYDIYTATGMVATTMVSNIIYINTRELDIRASAGVVSAPLRCSIPLSVSTSPGFSTEYSYATSDYTVTWTVPQGWSITSSSSDGKNINVLSDASTGGQISGVVKLSCGFTKTIVIPIVRSEPQISFLSYGSVLCAAGDQLYTISPVCGAVSYTYTLSNGIATFPNGIVYTVTTTDPSFVVTYPAAGRYTTLVTATANFADGTTTNTASVTTHSGAPLVTIEPYTVNCFSNTLITASNYSQYSSLSWYTYDDVLLNEGQSASVPNDVFFVKAIATNICGTSTTSVRIPRDDCAGAFLISPNPVRGNIHIILQPEIAVAKSAAGKEDIQINLYDINSTRLVRYWKIKPGQKDYNLNIAGIPKGTYIVQLISQGVKKAKKIVVE
jgi:hypothetical protein